jgi:uncharacterized protein YuzE
MAKKALVDYDKENDILYVTTKQKISDSLGFDNFVIDFSPKGKIVAVEIMKASDFVKNFMKISKGSLSNVKHARMSVIQSKEYAMIKILLAVPKIKDNEPLFVPTPVPEWQSRLPSH